ncbi:MAG: hypothetical protein VKL01_01375 [Limnothrix sp.]|uniref:Uncharacterized protein n=1 Tax=Limnothrix redekei LRLZ20PSL1 TaxID=3112953 RepID=A0ABW7C514_9CYAN|nr:hypothetical protein [Limnothrix sp. PR1529]MEB3116988.1 hypothetical protein [Limnothrix sp.]
MRISFTGGAFYGDRLVYFRAGPGLCQRATLSRSPMACCRNAELLLD